MQTHYSFYFRVLLLLLVTTLFNSSEPCTDHILSVSDINKCSNGVCLFEELVHKRLELGTDTGLCIRLNGELANSPSQTYKLKILHSQIVYDLVDCYDTDDPSINMYCKCGCPFGTTITEASCPVLPNSSPNTFVVMANYVSGSPGANCALPGGRNYCMRIHINTSSRYKVCSLSQPFIELLLDSQTPSGQKQHDIIIKNTASFWDAGDWNITFYPNTIRNDLENHFIIQDSLNPQLFYILKPHLVNKIDERNIDKLGWARPNDVLTVALPNNRITQRLKSCTANQCYLSLSVPTFDSALTSNFLFNNVKPGSLLIHDNAPTIQIGVVETFENLEEMDSGLWILDSNGKPVPLGTFVSNRWPHSANNIETVTMKMTGSAVDYTGSAICSDWFIVRTAAIGNVITSIKECAVMTNGLVTRWGWCRHQMDTSVNPPIETNICNTASTGVTINPVGSAINFVVNIVNGVFTVVNEQPSGSVLDMLVIDPISESLEITAELQGLNLTFEFSNVEPEILKIEDHKDTLQVFYKAKSRAEGKCYLGANKDITPTVEINVEREQDSYDLPIIVSKFNGDIVISIVCAVNSDHVKFKVDINRDNVDINKKSINDTSVRERSLDHDDSSWIWDFGFSETINNIISIIIIIAVTLVSLIIMILFILPLTKYLVLKLWGLFNSKPKMHFQDPLKKIQ